MGELAVSRAFGDADLKKIDAKIVIAEPEITTETVRPSPPHHPSLAD
jgi:hypothetical protein